MRITRCLSWCQEPIKYKRSHFILTLSGKLIGKESSNRTSLERCPCAVKQKTKQNTSWFTNDTQKISLFFTWFWPKSLWVNLTHHFIHQAGFWMASTSYHESNPPSKGKDLSPQRLQAFKEHPFKEFPKCLRRTALLRWMSNPSQGDYFKECDICLQVHVSGFWFKIITWRYGCLPRIDVAAVTGLLFVDVTILLSNTPVFTVNPLGHFNSSNSPTLSLPQHAYLAVIVTTFTHWFGSFCPINHTL